MMAAVTFDTLEYMDALKRSGMNPETAEAITKATAKAFTQMLEAQQIATKKDLHEAKSELLKAISESSWRTITSIATIQTIILGIFALIHYIHG